MSKKEAVQELFDGLLSKFGDSPNNRSLILQQIKELLSKKSKISVKDLDSLEEKVKKLQKKIFESHHSRVSPENYSISPKSSKTPKASYPKEPESFEPVLRSRSRFYKSRAEHSSLKQLMTTDCRNKIKLKHKHDEWGKIIKNESVRYMKELDLMKQKKKRTQNQYFQELSQQISRNKERVSYIKKETEGLEKSITEQANLELDQTTKELEQKKSKTKLKEKQNIQEFLTKKSERKFKLMESLREDKEAIMQRVNSFYDEEYRKMKKKMITMKEVESDNLFNSGFLKTQKSSQKYKGMQYDLEHIAKNTQIWDDSEKNYKKLMQEKIKKAQDSSRLLKIMMFKPKSLKELEALADSKELETLASIKEEEKHNSLKTLEKLENDRKALKATLDEQIKEKEAQKIKEKLWINEQGAIWKQQDDITLKHHQVLQKSKKRRQKDLRIFYDAQLEEKLKQDLESYQLSPYERQINKHMYFPS